MHEPMVGAERAEPRLHQFLVIRIEGRPPTPNARRPWPMVHRENAHWKHVAEAAAAGALHLWQVDHDLAWHPVKRCVVSVAFGLPDKRNRDLDNLIASTKPLLDGIVAAGVIVDDSISVIQKMEFGAVVNGTTETIFTIDEIEA